MGKFSFCWQLHNHRTWSLLMPLLPQLNGTRLLVKRWAGVGGSMELRVARMPLKTVNTGGWHSVRETPWVEREGCEGNQNISSSERKMKMKGRN